VGTTSERFNRKHTVKVEVTPETMTVYVNGEEFGTHADTTLARAGASIGLRQSSSEKTRLYSLKVEDTSGNLLWEDNISEAKAGDAVTDFKKLSGSGTPSYKTDENGETYLYVNNCIITAGEQGGTWKQLSLPEEYTVSGTFQATLPAGASSSSVGLSVCMADVNTFYMPQVSLKEGSKYEGLRFLPHKQQNGWTIYDSVDHSDLIPAADRYTKPMEVEMKVDAEKIVVYVNGTEFGTMNNTDLPRIGSSVGFRQSGGEHTRVYDMQITDADGKVIWKDDIGKTAVGATPALFKTLNGGTCQVQADENGTKYLYLNNTICTVGSLENITVDTYSFKNSTNIQGTPYLKVRSETGGETIAISSDSTAHNGGESVVHWYVTKPGEQEWEAMGWMNGWQIDFEIPSTVEVLELGFRKSGYATDVGGVASTDNEKLNQLYQEAYDTLDITMRDTYMDCPDRERCQWWGDAVNEMQQAAYAMDHTARLLYEKCLTQVVGWSEHKGGPLTTVVATPTFNELPMQSLNGAHSLWQYYLYYGETEILEYCYDSFMRFLRLWNISDSGVIGHRGGNWDWMDWGDHPDVAVIESSWYYVAAGNMIKVAEVLGKDQADIDDLENRRALLKENFDSLYWDESRGAYYSTTSDGKADDRGNALAVYSGLADPSRYPQMLKVFQTIEKSSPYMEKYVLEAMYMMGYAEEAITRTLKRYDGMIKDGYPTLYEYWAANKLSGNGGTGTRNHAWSGAPLSMMYMFNAGITPTGAGFETFRVRPMLGSLSHAEAWTDTVSGTISVDVTTDTLNVTVPEGSESALICVPRLDVPTTVKLGDAVVYDNGAAAATLPAGVTYAGEDVDYVNFTVVPGTYTFTAVEDTADTAETHTITIHAVGDGEISVNGEAVTAPYTYTGSGEVTVVATPAKGSRTMAITGSYPETVISKEAVTRTYTLDRDLVCNVTFEAAPATKITLDVLDTSNMPYAMNAYVAGKLVSLPYNGAFNEGETVTVRVEPVEPLNYEVVWADSSIEGNETTVTMTDSVVLNVGVREKDCLNTLKIASINASSIIAGNNSWKKENAIDGNRVAVSGANGYSSDAHQAKDVSGTPVVMTLDLGSVQKLNQVSLFPRTDAATMDGKTCSFPVDFTIAVSENGSEYETVYTLIDGENPLYKQKVYCFDDVEARYVKITVTELGDSASNENPYPLYRVQLAEIEVAYNSEQISVSDEEVAAAVDALIAAVNVEDKATIEAARAAYDALTDEQKELVTRLAELEAAELVWKTVNTEVSLVLTGPESVRVYDEAVTYTLSGKDMVNLATFILTVDLPEELLAQPVVESADPDWYVIYQGVENGVLTISAGNNNGDFGDGEILTITLVPTGKTGDAAVSVTKAELSAFVGVEDETFVSANLDAAAVTTKVEHNIFDVNRDGVVNILDLTRAQRYYDTDNAIADFDGSGKVDIADLIMILNHYTDIFQ